MDSTDHDALPAVLSVSGIGKTYAEPVLADVSLSLRAGEVLAFTGENGAGKRTLSKIIGGLVEPTAGTMCLGEALFAPAIAAAKRCCTPPATHEAGSLS